jgi:hypothetical protein
LTWHSHTRNISNFRNTIRNILVNLCPAHSEWRAIWHLIYVNKMAQRPKRTLCQPIRFAEEYSDYIPRPLSKMLQKVCKGNLYEIEVQEVDRDRNLVQGIQQEIWWVETLRWRVGIFPFYKTRDYASTVRGVTEWMSRVV